jgi:asparagine synthase (glutamine-hydrolysing)
MCGIAGIYHFDSERPVEEYSLNKMINSISHRGPDDSGTYISGNLGLAHNRLSIIDLSENGHQPFLDDTKRYCIVFNGEIYNFKELKQRLNKSTYKSNTDTEVLLNLYIEIGPEMLNLLNGMFVFVIWDNKTKSLFVARDRLGVKPFYYCIIDNTFYFASEQKSLFAAGINPHIDHTTFEELLLFRNISGDRCVFKGVFKLLPGHYLKLNGLDIVITRWWNLSKIALALQNSFLPKNPLEWFEETFNSSTQYRSISDVPIGVLLSGGLDSSSIAASLFNNRVTNLSSFTVSFRNPDYDETKLAKICAEKFGITHHSLYVENDQLISSLEEAIWAHDDPLMHQNDAQLLAISKYAKPYVSVLMSGEGGDETMGGYVRYRALRYLSSRKLLNVVTKGFLKFNNNSRLSKLHNYTLIKNTYDSVLLNSCILYPKDFEKYGIYVSPYCSQYRNNMLNEAMSLYNTDFVRQAMYLDQHTYLNSLLDRNDRTTMAASIECREPFLDFRLVEMLAALPTDLLDRGFKGKHILLKSIGRHLPKPIINYRKWGFGVPWEHYFRTSPYFIGVLNDMKKSEIFKYPIFEKFKPEKIIHEFEVGNNLDAPLIRQLMMIHLWHKLYFERISKT